VRSCASDGDGDCAARGGGGRGRVRALGAHCTAHAARRARAAAAAAEAAANSRCSALLAQRTVGEGGRGVVAESVREVEPRALQRVAASRVGLGAAAREGLGAHHDAAVLVRAAAALLAAVHRILALALVPLDLVVRRARVRLGDAARGRAARGDDEAVDGVDARREVGDVREDLAAGVLERVAELVEGDAALRGRRLDLGEQDVGVGRREGALLADDARVLAQLHPLQRRRGGGGGSRDRRTRRWGRGGERVSSFTLRRE